MKKNYVKPQIITRNTCVKNYIICSSKRTDLRGAWEDMMTKDRNTGDDIWGSDSNEESAW